MRYLYFQHHYIKHIRIHTQFNNFLTDTIFQKK